METIKAKPDFTYTMTSTILLRADGSISEESISTTKNWDGLISWTATRKLSISADTRSTQTEATTTQSSTLYSLQGIYNWSTATRISAGYTFNTNSLIANNESTSVRLSIETRF